MSGYVVKIRGAVGSEKQRDYVCDHCGRFDLLIFDPPPDVTRCPTCDGWGQRVLSAPPVHTQFVVSATQGKSEPPPHPKAMDLRPLGEGQKLSEWRKERAKVHEADRHKRIKELLS